MNDVCQFLDVQFDVGVESNIGDIMIVDLALLDGLLDSQCSELHGC